MNLLDLVALRPLILNRLYLTLVRPQAPYRETENGRLGGFVALKCGFPDVQWAKRQENGDLINVEDLG